MTQFVAPIDSTHAIGVAYRSMIRARVQAYRQMEIVKWQPAPCPPDWKAPPNNRRP